MYLLISEILGFLDASPASRNFIEGENILNAGHLLSCGCVEKSDSKISIFGFCLQTSKLSAAPHEIKGDFIIHNGKMVIGNMQCSCKAGLGERCKHIAAVLLFCTRNDVDKLEMISKTEIKCLWNQKNSKTMYNPMPLLETPCFSKSSDNVNTCIPLSTESEKDVLNMFISNLPDSALALFSSDQRKIKIIEDVVLVPSRQKLEEETRLQQLFTHCSNSDCMTFIYFSDFPSVLNNCCVQTYNDYFPCEDNLKICRKTKEDKSLWREKRKFRITGSTCYGLYTYSKSNWEKKIHNFFWPKDISNKFLRYGLEFESVARSVYEKKYNVTVEQFGFIINQKNPWLGYSPDGIIFENGVSRKLIEIKCPYRGKILPIKDLVLDCKYILKKHNKFELKEKHNYYGQVQLGMAILNIQECDFIIYSSKDNDIEVINVKLNILFVKNLLVKLKNVFFDKMLHVLCENINKQ